MLRNVLSYFADSFRQKYYETLDDFLRSLGITEDNIHEYEMRTHYLDLDQSNSLSGQIWHEDKMIGEIKTSFESDRGYYIKISCRKIGVKDDKSRR